MDACAGLSEYEGDASKLTRAIMLGNQETSEMKFNDFGRPSDSSHKNPVWFTGDSIRSCKVWHKHCATSQ